MHVTELNTCACSWFEVMLALVALFIRNNAAVILNRPPEQLFNANLNPVCIALLREKYTYASVYIKKFKKYKI